MKSLGVVVPMLNEEQHIWRTLRSVLHAAGVAGMRCELVVVDNGSTDGGCALAQSLGARVVPAPGLAIGALRNLGAQQLHTDYLAFLDADIEVPDNWLSCCLDALNDGFDVVALDCDTPAQASWYARDWQKRSMSQTGSARERDWLATPNLFMCRKTFEDSGGFHPDLPSGEDKEFGLRLHAAGVRQISLARPVALHWGYEKTWSEWMGKELWRQGSHVRLFKQAPSLRLARFPLLCLFTLLASLLCVLLWLGGHWSAGGLLLGAGLLPAAVLALRQSFRRLEVFYSLRLLVLHWLRLHIGCVALLRPVAD